MVQIKVLIIKKTRLLSKSVDRLTREIDYLIIKPVALLTRCKCAGLVKTHTHHAADNDDDMMRQER